MCITTERNVKKTNSQTLTLRNIKFKTGIPLVVCLTWSRTLEYRYNPNLKTRDWGSRGWRPGTSKGRWRLFNEKRVVTFTFRRSDRCFTMSRRQVVVPVKTIYFASHRLVLSFPIRSSRRTGVSTDLGVFLGWVGFHYVQCQTFQLGDKIEWI